MRILWFEVTPPAAYVSEKDPIGGWQDSLERVVKGRKDIELFIAFVSNQESEVKVIDGVTYIPIVVLRSFGDRLFRKYWDVYADKMLPRAKWIVDKYNPELIHVFGTEWPFGLIAEYTNIPVVIHIMGSMIPYNNAFYPPGYSFLKILYQNLWHLPKMYKLWKKQIDGKNREEWERKTWLVVKNYMGRTDWDAALSRIMHPNRNYFHVDEALRLDFIYSKEYWHFSDDGKLRLISTGCSSFWKGPDMMLKVAKILTNLKVNFEWLVIGNMNDTLKMVVERQEGCRFEDCHLQILGFKKPSELMYLLCSSTIYVHTAYIENSPNSICEAQCLGVPVVSTNVGGISTLLRNDVDGVLVAANEPWQMADAILRLFSDRERLIRYSRNSLVKARQRHNDEHIRSQLFQCYYSLLDGKLGQR